MEELTPASDKSDETQYGAEKVRSATLYKASLLGLLILLVGILAWNTFRPEPKWDYKIEDIPDANFTAELNARGQDGWELVFARRASVSEPSASSKPEFSYEMIFKRRSR